MSVEAASLDRVDARFGGANFARATFAPRVWDGFRAVQPYEADAECTGGFAWGGSMGGGDAVMSSGWALTVSCQANGTDSSNESGGWLLGEMVLQ